MRGTAEDEQQAVKLRSKINGDYVWFRQDGKSYYTADQAIVTQVRNLFQPMEEVSQKEVMLGQEKAKLSAEKEKLSDLKTELLGHTNTMRPEQVREQLGVLRDRISRLRGKEASETELQDLEQRIQELQAGLGQSREAAYSRLADLSRQQSALSDQQSEIGARQLALSAEKNG